MLLKTRSTYLKTIAIIFLLELGLSISLVLLAQSFKVSAVSDLIRVFEDGYNLPKAQDTLKLFGIRGEIISGQFMIQAKRNLDGLRVEVDNLTHHTTGHSLTRHITLNFVGSVMVTQNAGNQTSESYIREAPARIPDYLSEENQISLKKGRVQAVWLTIEVPEKTQSGKYLGHLKVSSNNGEQEALPIALTVYPLTLPMERHLKVTEWFSTNYFPKFHGIKEKYSKAWFDMLSIYAENMVAHRQNIFRVPMNAVEIRKTMQGELEFDFSRFDQMAQVFWDTQKMDYLETGELAKFGEEGWYSTDIVLKDQRVIDMRSGDTLNLPGEEVVPYLLPALENHLRGKGWLDKTLFHIKDEPTTRNARSWRKMSSYMHSLAPDLKRMDAIETTYLFGELEIAVPKLDYLESNFELYKKGQQQGAELWIYTVGIYQSGKFPNKTIDMPLIGNRVLHWLNYRYDLSGFLHWGWNYWITENPFKDAGEHVGDGWHVYPAKDGLINSLRWEQMRNGIQDYEYLWMLEKETRHLKDSLGARFDWIDPTQRGKEIASRVVMSLRDYTKDPLVLYQARKEVLKELMDFNKSPLLYIQTNPPENTSIRVNGWVGEVFGWTEPGTRIEIDGEEVPVSDQGLFMRNVKILKDKKYVTIKAFASDGTKEIVRSFDVL